QSVNRVFPLTLTPCRCIPPSPAGKGLDGGVVPIIVVWNGCGCAPGVYRATQGERRSGERAALLLGASGALLWWVQRRETLRESFGQVSTRSGTVQRRQMHRLPLLHAGLSLFGAALPVDQARALRQEVRSVLRAD